MTIRLNDRANIEGVKRLADGRLTAVAKFARSGVYSYTGAEVGRPDLGTVKVYRADDEVFAADAMASFAHKAITLGHPTDGVSAANWSAVSVGFTEGRVARDGGFVVIPMMVADAAAVAAIDSGSARELSAGYSCDLVWGAGTTPAGETFDAKQVGIRGDHIALVGAGRAGSECRVGDSASRPTFLRDAAGAPVTLYDRSNGGRLTLTNDHINAIEAEAAKAGMAVTAYVSDVLRYSLAS